MKTELCAGTMRLSLSFFSPSLYIPRLRHSIFSSPFSFIYYLILYKPSMYSIIAQGCLKMLHKGQSNENRIPAIKHIPRKSWQHCSYVSILPSEGQETCIVKTHKSTHLFLYCSGGDISVNYVHPTLEMEVNKEEQKDVVHIMVAEGAATRHTVKTSWNAFGRDHSYA